ncbi:MAG TPA: carboxypeptidase regulatory-like domain-containing protein [Pyrinomonadaceae bacterium]
MSKYAYRRGIAAVLLLLVTFVMAGAQESRGSLTGTVTDPNGAALPGATVEIKNVETNVANTATTNEDGNFSFPLLNPGMYTLTITAQGFSNVTRENIEIRVADRLTLDVPMSVTGVGETVTTVASAPVLETASVSTGTTITNQQISELPLAEGTAYQLATLAPGVAYTGNPQFVGPTSNGNLAAFRTNGATGSNQITLDGSPNYAFDGGVGFSPPSDAVQEFKVQTSQFDAQQGYSAGATVNVAVKSGTNDLHGSAWYFNRDRSRTANNFFANRAGQDRPERTYHRFGGVVGGPVRLPGIYNGSDRTFFFTTYERLKDNIAEPQLFTVPTARMRTGDFSELILNRNNIADASNVVIFNPFAATVAGNGTVTRASFGCPTSGAVTAAFPNCNVIPTNLLNPVALAALSYYPLPNTVGQGTGGLQNNFFSNQNRVQNYRAWLTRLDHRISDRQTVFGKYYHSFNPEDRQDAFGEVNGFPITAGFEDRTNDGGSVDYTNTLTNSTVLDIRVSFNRFEQMRRPAAAFDPASLGFAASTINAMRGYQYIPRFVVTNLDSSRNTRSTLGAQRSDWNEGRTRPFMMGAIQPTITQLMGNHTMRYGYDFRNTRENFITNNYQGGSFSFDGVFTAPASNSNTATRNAYGRDVAAFILGLPSSAVIDNPQSYSVQSNYHGFFFQDDWRVTPKLTLNMGLRYELEMGLTERFDRIQRGFNLTTPTSVDAAVRAAYTTTYNAQTAAARQFLVAPDQFRVVGGVTFADANNRAIWDADKTNWQPRVGAAYSLNDKTVLRGGFGIFMAPFQVETPLQAGFSTGTQNPITVNNGATFLYNLTNPFPGGSPSLLAPQGTTLGLLTNVGQALGASDAPLIPVERKNAKFARMIFGFQRELPGQFVVEANYVTSWGYDQSVNRNINFVPRQFLATDEAGSITANTNLTATIPNPFLGRLAGTNSTLNTATTIQRQQTLLPFPQFGNLFVQEYNGTNRYNALQTQVNKRFSRDFSLTMTYTYSRLRERISYLNPSDTDLENRISIADRPHRFTLAETWVLPIGRGRTFGKEMNRIVDAFVGGWQVNGTYEWQSGEPFNLTSNLFFDGDLDSLAARVGDSNGAGQKYGIDIPAIYNINGPNGARLVTLNAFGIRNVPSTLDNLRNQPYSIANLSLTKNFHVAEGKRIQVRAEAINAFNHPYFGSGIGLNPGSTAAPNAAFGFVTSQRNNPRDIQIGAKFTF